MTARAPYKAVVVGCGRIGSSYSSLTAAPGVHSHAQAYAAHPRVALVGLCDPDPRRLREAAALWKAEDAVDAAALCRRLKPDVVSLCTPDGTHAALARRILAVHAPRALFMEKPLAATAAEAVEVLRLARAKRCAVAVNYTRRFSPAFRALRRELEAGRHGRPLLGRVLYGKGLLHNGSHAIDLFRFWLGEPVRILGSRREAGGDAYAVDFLFKGGFRLRLDPFDEGAATVFELDVMCERTRWRSWFGGRKWEFSSRAADPVTAGYRAFVPDFRECRDERFFSPLAGCLPEAVDNIVRHLDGKEALACAGADGLAALRWVEEARRHADTGRRR